MAGATQDPIKVWEHIYQARGSGSDETVPKYLSLFSGSRQSPDAARRAPQEKGPHAAGAVQVGRVGTGIGCR
jgi:hypothetical protein